MCDTNKRDCRCHRAVMNGYHGMKQSGAAESEALDAAFRIHKFHHPEMAEDASRLTVERWLYAGHVH